MDSTYDNEITIMTKALQRAERKYNHALKRQHDEDIDSIINVGTDCRGGVEILLVALCEIHGIEGIEGNMPKVDALREKGIISDNLLRKMSYIIRIGNTVHADEDKEARLTKSNSRICVTNLQDIISSLANQYGIEISSITNQLPEPIINPPYFDYNSRPTFARWVRFREDNLRTDPLYCELEEKADKGDVQAALDIAAGFLDKPIQWGYGKFRYIIVNRNDTSSPNKQYYSRINKAVRLAQEYEKWGKDYDRRYIATAMYEFLYYSAYTDCATIGTYRRETILDVCRMLLDIVEKYGDKVIAPAYDVGSHDVEKMISGVLYSVTDIASVNYCEVQSTSGKTVVVGSDDPSKVGTLAALVPYITAKRTRKRNLYQREQKQTDFNRYTNASSTPSANNRGSTEYNTERSRYTNSNSTSYANNRGSTNYNNEDDSGIFRIAMRCYYLLNLLIYWGILDTKHTRFPEIISFPLIYVLAYIFTGIMFTVTKDSYGDYMTSYCPVVIGFYPFIIDIFIVFFIPGLNLFFRIVFVVLQLLLPIALRNGWIDLL